MRTLRRKLGWVLLCLGWLPAAAEARGADDDDGAGGRESRRADDEETRERSDPRDERGSDEASPASRDAERRTDGDDEYLRSDDDARSGEEKRRELDRDDWQREASPGAATASAPLPRLVEEDHAVARLIFSPSAFVEPERQWTLTSQNLLAVAAGYVPIPRLRVGAELGVPLLWGNLHPARVEVKYHHTLRDRMHLSGAASYQHWLLLGADVIPTGDTAREIWLHNRDGRDVGSAVGLHGLFDLCLDHECGRVVQTGLEIFPHTGDFAPLGTTVQLDVGALWAFNDIVKGLAEVQISNGGFLMSSGGGRLGLGVRVLQPARRLAGDVSIFLPFGGAADQVFGLQYALTWAPE